MRRWMSRPTGSTGIGAERRALRELRAALRAPDRDERPDAHLPDARTSCRSTTLRPLRNRREPNSGQGGGAPGTEHRLRLTGHLTTRPGAAYQSIGPCNATIRGTRSTRHARSTSRGGSFGPATATASRSFCEPWRPKKRARPGRRARCCPRRPRRRRLARSREKTRAACRALSLGVAEAWAIADEEGSARATKRLLARADRLGIALGGHGRPSGRGRAAGPAGRAPRLEDDATPARARVVRHGGDAPRAPGDRRPARRDCARRGSSDRRRAHGRRRVERRRGRRRRAGRSPGRRDRRRPDRRLAGRRRRLLARLERRAATVLALRRALRQPSFAVRSHALHALAHATPCAVAPDDLVLVLRDMVTNAPPDVLAGGEEPGVQEDWKRTSA